METEREFVAFLCRTMIAIVVTTKAKIFRGRQSEKCSTG